jgi:hypothetical protein
MYANRFFSALVLLVFMEGTQKMTDTMVEARDGALFLRLGPDGPFGVARLGFPGGGSFGVDPGCPSRLVGVQVQTPDAALSTLGWLLGEDAAAALASGDAASWSGGDVGLVVAPQPGAAALCRWAFASWYRRWTPLAVPEGLLQIDVGVAAAAAGNLRAAFTALDQGADALLSATAELLDSPVAPLLHTRLAAAVAVAVDVLGPNHRDAGSLVAAMDSLAVPAEEVVLPPGFDLVALGLALAAPVGQLGHQVGTVHAGSVDWTLVPPRVLATDEGTILTSMTESEIVVEVAGHPLLDPAAAPARGLLVRLVNPDTAQVVVGAPLVWDGAAREFIARIPRDRLDPDTAAEALLTDVAAARSLTRAGVGQVAVQRAGLRHAVRSLAAIRMAAAAAALGHDALVYELRGHGHTEAMSAARTYGRLTTGEHADLAAAADRWTVDLRLPEPSAVLGAWLGASPARGVVVPDSLDVSGPLLCELVTAHRSLRATR